MSSLVSVIIPCYNCEAHVAQTIDSVVQQSYSNWELILVNDGSTDNTLTVLKGFENEKIKVLTQENAGVSTARNAGAQLAQGAFIAFLDSDDIWKENYLQRKVDTAIEHEDAGLFLSIEQDIDESYQLQNNYYVPCEDDVAKKVATLDTTFVAGPSNTFIRSEVFRSTPGYDPRLSNAADKMFFVQVALVTKIKFIPEVLVLYKVHADNMHKNIGLMVADYMMFLKVLAETPLWNQPEVRKLSRSRIYKICSAALLHNGNLLKGMSFAFRSFLVSPTNLVLPQRSKKRLRTLAMKSLRLSGVSAILEQRNRRKGRVPILLFHRISPVPDPVWEPLHPVLFEEIIGRLSTKYKFISLQELFTEKPDNLNDTCAIVFDDGFRDFYDYAFPILQQYKVPTTVFLNPHCIDSGQPIWTNVIDGIVRETSVTKYSLTFGKKATLVLEKDEQKRVGAELIKQALCTLPKAQRKEEIEKIASELGCPDPAIPPLMNWGEIEALKERGIDFQSHGHTHNYLPTATDQEIETEIGNAKQMLRDRLGVEADFFAYPIGGYDDRCKAIAAQHHKAAFAVTNEQVDLTSLDDDRKFEIPRINVYHQTSDEVILFMNQFHQMIKR